MPVDDVYLAMVALDDPDTLARTARGDWSALAHLDLSDDERTLVEGLVEEEAADGEVEGFAGGARFAAVRHVSGKVSPSVLRQFPAQQYAFRSWFGDNMAACAGGNPCKGQCS